MKVVTFTTLASLLTISLAGCAGMGGPTSDQMYQATELCREYAQMDIESTPGFSESGHWFATVNAWAPLYPEDLVDGAGTIKGTFEAATPSGDVTYGSYSCDVTNFTEVDYLGYDNTRE